MVNSSFLLPGWKWELLFDIAMLCCEATSDGVWRRLDPEYIAEGKSWETSQVG
jgi:hypothetical protein